MKLTIKGVYTLTVIIYFYFCIIVSSEYNSAKTLYDVSTECQRNQFWEMNTSTISIVIHKDLNTSWLQLSDSKNNFHELKCQNINGTFYKCLPSFIIAGTQKSGTTALAGALNSHPLIEFAKKKEIHFFDKFNMYKKGLSNYVSRFPTLDISNKNQLILYAEATPYYVASRLACQRISSDIPNVKLIILLRNPIDRAYSEFQMKVRRIKQQEDFFSLIEIYKVELFKCLVIESKRKSSRHIRSISHSRVKKYLNSCVPKELKNNHRWNKLVKALVKSINVFKNWDIVIRSCFSLAVNDNSTRMLISELFTTHQNSNNYSIRMKNLRFTPKECWINSKDGLEEIKSMEDAFIGEVKAFLNCSKNIIIENGMTNICYSVCLLSFNRYCLIG